MRQLGRAGEPVFCLVRLIADPRWFDQLPPQEVTYAQPVHPHSDRDYVGSGEPVSVASGLAQGRFSFNIRAG